MYRLYDLENDLMEMNDLESDPKQAAKLADMKAVLEKLQIEMNDPLLN